MTEVELLKSAHALIADPLRWTRGSHACNSDNKGVRVYDSSAVKFCALGALYRTSWDNVGTYKLSAKACRFLDSASELLYKESPVIVNDGMGHEAIMKVYEKAIEMAAKEK